jgi:tetratricopeptide (TPR) repeat protein
MAPEPPVPVESGRTQERIAELEQRIAQADAEVDIWTDRADAYRMQAGGMAETDAKIQSLRNAQSCISRASEACLRRDQALYDLAQIHLQLNHREEAIRLLQRVDSSQRSMTELGVAARRQLAGLGAGRSHAGHSLAGKRSGAALQCSAVTRRGSRCERRTTNPSGRCWQHGG